MSHTAVLDKRIYLDYASTTPVDKKVLKKMMPFFSVSFGNPSSLYSSGRQSKQAIDKSRKEVASILNTSPTEIVFTGSGTESDNLAILGVARANKKNGNHIIISAIEHKAVIEATQLLKEEGFEITVLPVNKEGLIDVDECIGAITTKTILVSVMYANNEIGTIEPINELSEAIRKKRGLNMFPLFHTDACQAAGYFSLNVRDLGIDLMTLNGSKIYGPKGIGILYKKEGIKIQPIVVGGGQEIGLRAGTENVANIVGFTEALKLVSISKEKESKRLIDLRDYFIKKINDAIPEAVLNGHKIYRLPNNINISIPYIEGESVILMLDELGIEAGTGSACSSYNLKPSHVLFAIGQDTNLIHGSIRFTLGKYTKKSDIDYLMSVFPNIINKLKNMSALTAKKYEQKK